MMQSVTTNSKPVFQHHIWAIISGRVASRAAARRAVMTRTHIALPAISCITWVQGQVVSRKICWNTLNIFEHLFITGLRNPTPHHKPCGAGESPSCTWHLFQSGIGQLPMKAICLLALWLSLGCVKQKLGGQKWSIQLQKLWGMCVRHGSDNAPAVAKGICRNDWEVLATTTSGFWASSKAIAFKQADMDDWIRHWELRIITCWNYGNLSALCVPSLHFSSIADVSGWLWKTVLEVSDSSPHINLVSDEWEHMKQIVGEWEGNEMADNGTHPCPQAKKHCRCLPRSGAGWSICNVEIQALSMITQKVWGGFIQIWRYNSSIIGQLLILDSSYLLELRSRNRSLFLQSSFTDQ